MPRLFAVQLKDGPAERYEQWVNTPVYTHDYEDCVGWLGCELPEGGHSCEFAELAGDGAVTCVSSSKVNRLRNENTQLRKAMDFQALELGCMTHNRDVLHVENAKLRELVRIMHGELVACEDNGYVCGGHKFDDRIRELGIEVQS